MAAAIILVAGVVQALAGEATGEGVQDQKVVVDINGAVQTIRLADLGDGESRQLAAGTQTVTVTRSGQKLDVLLDGEGLLHEEPASGETRAVVWVGEDEEAAGEARRVVVVKGAEGGSVATTRTVTVRTREGEDDEELTVDVESIGDGDLSEGSGAGGTGTMIFTTDDPGSEPVVVAAPGRRPGMVRYRCEATGSELLVAKDKATADSYVCPATGCVMTRVAEPEVRVIKVIKKLETGDDEPTE
jgi:hypothetical protein